VLDAWQKKLPLKLYTISGAEKDSWQDHLFNNTGLSELPGMVQKGMRSEGTIYTTSAISDYGLLMSGSMEPLSDENIDILQRFGRVFQQSYTRYLDVQMAEAQARESQIQLAMERVRARTMAMQHSDELKDAAALLFQQAKALGVPAYSCGYNIWEKNEKEFTSWMSTQDGSDFNGVPNIPLTKDSNFIRYAHSKQEGEPFFVLELRGERMQEHYAYLKTIPPFKAYFEYAISVGFDLPETQIHHLANFSQGNLLFITLEPCPEFHEVFKRFAAVFEQTYTRFLDLQKAEDQAKEAQIQLAMERVRARTMAMQRSGELTEAASLLFKQVQSFGVTAYTCGFNIWQADDISVTSWMANPDGSLGGTPLRLPHLEHPHFKQSYDARKRGEDFFVIEAGGKELEDTYRYMFSIPDWKDRFGDFADSEFPVPTFQISHYAFFSQGYLLFITYEPVPEMWDLFRRFAKVFEQTFTRFLDLQKAESQAREAQIEAALEKVRSRTMAMQRSEELGDVASVLFKQVEGLGIKSWSTGFNIWLEGNTSYIDWISSPAGGFLAPYTVDLSIHPAFRKISEARQRGEDFYVLEFEGEQIVEAYRLLSSFGDKKQFENLLESGFQFPKRQFNHYVFGAQVSLMFITYEAHPEAWDIFKRFGKVFEQTYTRFLDLQKAESQAKEATIEAALEKVRGKAMAMHNSKDLSTTASIVFTELKKLGVDLTRSGVALLSKDSREARLYAATVSSEADALDLIGLFDMSAHPCMSMQYESWLKNESFFPVLNGEELKAYRAVLSSRLPLLAPYDEKSDQEEYGYYFPFTEGLFFAWTLKPYGENEIKLLSRFKTIIDLTFRRYIELQKSEANAWEAVRRASLDRVRAETASMRSTSDLERIQPLIWNELTTLGVPFIRCGVFIMDEEHQLVHTFLSTPDGKAIAAFRQPYNTPGETSQIIAHWHKKKMYRQHWDEAQFIAFTKNLVDQGAITSGEKYLTENRPTNLDLHFFPFLQGMLYVGNTAPLNDDELHLVQNLANAFSSAYARYEDFSKLESAKVQIENTLVDLKQAQSQLVQSEKMASLGELTAGIAHEIQNPLNFVTNFSEVNKELLAELQAEMDKGNIKEVKALARDVIQNEEKINHHGRRADAIVKGMLQHSQTTTGQKEPTDINNLADEYFRLSYHGLRAKNKSFHAGMHTEFDKTIGKINIVPQDIGRVLLNLYNNAFYAAAPSLGSGGNGNEQTNGNAAVWVSTKKLEDKVLISVKDNGPGIPQKVLDKIFQPFFTTKPTGQGTGLGLSLAYDIIKAHRGEIKVESKEGEGAEFIIQLPV
ncbi:MAG: sensor histidine kinase, partial [Chitinophagales bacterium]